MEQGTIEVVDRAGRTWSFGNYDSPSGPAFCITVPDELLDWAGGFTAHFDGTVNIEEAVR